MEELLQRPYWVIDILPKQVPKDSPGQYFAVEHYFRKGERFAAIKQKHINVILKLNCYRQISIDGEPGGNPPPEHIAEEMRNRDLYLLVDDSVILSERDDTYMTVFNPDEKLLRLIRTLAAAEGLFVWKPPGQAAASKRKAAPADPPRDFHRLTRYLPVLETDETLYDEENGYSDVIFRFLEDLELACENEPDNECLQKMKQIFDQEEANPGHIFRHLDEIIRGLKALEYKNERESEK